jgi:hypothetical protein
VLGVKAVDLTASRELDVVAKGYCLFVEWNGMDWDEIDGKNDSGSWCECVRGRRRKEGNAASAIVTYVSFQPLKRNKQSGSRVNGNRKVRM